MSNALTSNSTGHTALGVIFVNGVIAVIIKTITELDLWRTRISVADKCIEIHVTDQGAAAFTQSIAH